MDVMSDVAVDEPDLDDEDEPKRSWTKELWFLLSVALVLALVMKTFLVQAFFIPSGSMEQTLHGCDGCQGDRVLVNKLVYKFRDIHRGEIVVFNGKNTNFPSETFVEPPKNRLDQVLREVKKAAGMAPEEKDFIKRVIGLPGDTVACCVDEKVTVNGEPIDEPYVFLGIDPRPMDPFEPTTVPPGHLFVMGDNRHGSSDSRVKENGTVPIDSVVGRAFAVFWPRGRWRTLRVPETFQPKAAAAATPETVAPDLLALALAVPVTLARRRLRLRSD